MLVEIDAFRNRVIRIDIGPTEEQVRLEFERVARMISGLVHDALGMRQTSEGDDAPSRGKSKCLSCERFEQTEPIFHGAGTLARTA